jgi:prevent-host-death family protein
VTDATFIQEEPGSRAAEGLPDHDPPGRARKLGCATVRYVKKRRERVGIRELRQNLSVYLKRVAAGETLEVTERNRPVAILAPLPEASTPLGRLVATGRASAPVGDLLELGAPDGEPASTRLSEALAEEREERPT